MNIFALSPCPTKSARWLCDMHVNKMILETAQILSTAARELCPQGFGREGTKLYRDSHVNHPCVRWVMASKDNAHWLRLHLSGLATERKYRWPDRQPHKSFSVGCLAYQLLLNNAPMDYLRAPQTAFPLAMPNFFKYPDDPHRSYREYYIAKKLDLGRTGSSHWTRRKPPEWARPYLP